MNDLGSTAMLLTECSLANDTLTLHQMSAGIVNGEESLQGR